MRPALRALTAFALVAWSVTPAAAQKSVSKSISDGWESVIKDATKAAKKVTKAADEALTPKKSKKRKSVKSKEPDDDAKRKTPVKQAEEPEGPPVPLAHQSPAFKESEPPEPRQAKEQDKELARQPSRPELVKPDLKKPELKMEAAPARRLPAPPQNPAASTEGEAESWSASNGGPAKKDSLPQAEVVPLRHGKDLPAPSPEPAPPNKPLPITMIPPKSADPAANANTWPKEEIDAAKASCAAILKAVEAVTIAEAPVREGGCGAPAPVRLVSIGKNPEVALSPPPLVTCDLVAGLYQWMKNDIQPLSKRHFGSPVIKIETMSDYSCRMAYGRKGNKLSEHGKANALDIRGFVTAKGETAYVLEQWGKTDRDRKAEAAAIAAQKEAAAKATAAAANAGSKTALDKEKSNAALSQASLSGIPAKPVKPEAAAALDPDRAAAISIVPDAPRSKKSQFLHDAHDTACRVFGTSLGPESNEAHRNHFHVDMAERRRTKICE